MTTWRPEINRLKYKQVILYLLNSGARNDLLGKVKLFKLLYYIDFNHYQEFKTPITGDIYRKLPFGPVPVHAEQILSEMVSEELIQISTKPVGDYTQYVFTPLEKPESLPNGFAPSETRILEQIIEKWASSTTNEIVTATHAEAPWRAVNMGEEIPYALAFYRRGEYEGLPNNYEDLEALAIGG